MCVDLHGTVADTGGGGQGGLAPPPPPPPPHTHTHTHKKKNVLLTLLALDGQTLRKSYKAGLEVDLQQRQSIVGMQFVYFSSALCAEETHPSPRPLVCNCDRLYASPSFLPPNLAYPLIHHSGHKIFTLAHI